jgi:hypothetical protein
VTGAHGNAKTVLYSTNFVDLKSYNIIRLLYWAVFGSISDHHTETLSVNRNNSKFFSCLQENTGKRDAHISCLHLIL